MICDIAIAVIFIIFLVIGFKRGFVRSIYSMLSVIISIALLYLCRGFFVEFVVSSPVGKGIYDFFVNNYGDEIALKCSYAVTYVLSIIILYVILRFLIKALFNVMDLLAKLPLINFVNSLLGAVLGGISGILWIVIIINILYVIPKTSMLVSDSSIAQHFNLFMMNFIK